MKNDATVICATGISNKQFGTSSTETRLLMIYLSRFGISITTMCYAGALPILISAWGMSTVEAGSIQSAYNIGYALSLLGSSWLADRVGAQKVFVVSAVASALAFGIFAIFARSYASALWLFPMVAIANGGTYGTSIMMVSDLVTGSQRGRAIGWTLTAASIGYLVGIFLVVYVSQKMSYQWAFLLCSCGPILAAFFGLRAVLGGHFSHPVTVVSRGAKVDRESIWSRNAVLLTVGYTAHCWELLGMWAWTPAFLTSALKDHIESASALALWVAVCLHLGGAAATATMGPASDRLGRRRVLIAMALMGSVFSMLYGWMGQQATVVLLCTTFIYSFVVLGDSGVLSAAMTEAVPKNRLGEAIAFRSVFGFGAGALAPMVFGWILERNFPWSQGNNQWGMAFASLGAGGLIATGCAIALKSKIPNKG